MTVILAYRLKAHHNGESHFLPSVLYIVIDHKIKSMEEKVPQALINESLSLDIAQVISSSLSLLNIIVQLTKSMQNHHVHFNKA